MTAQSIIEPDVLRKVCAKHHLHPEHQYYAADALPPGPASGNSSCSGNNSPIKRYRKQRLQHSASSSVSLKTPPKLSLDTTKSLNSSTVVTASASSRSHTRSQSNATTRSSASGQQRHHIHSLQSTGATEVVIKSGELVSPNMVLRNRKGDRSANSANAVEQQSHERFLLLQENVNGVDSSHRHSSNSLPLHQDGAEIGAVPLSIKRKSSLSSGRDHVPAVINTNADPDTFKVYVEESSPVETSLRHVQVEAEKQKGTDADGVNSNDINGRANHTDGEDDINSKSSNTDNEDDKDEDDDFDWEEDKVHEIKEKDAEAVRIAMLESDVCCRPLHRRIHPWVTQLIKNALLVALLMIPRFILHHVHTHHHETIVLIEDGRPYMAVVIGNHLGYFVIQFFTMGVFKIIHNFGSVKVKITLETHDALVPHIARSVWLFMLIAFWVVFVHQPTCDKAKSALEFPAIAEEGVDRECRRWIFWWVHRCLWGIQAMNILYILKRYTMQIVSDRFEQDNSKFVELNFQGHVLDALQKIKHQQYNAHNSGRSYHRMSTLHGPPYRWTEKSTTWLSTGHSYQGGRSPLATSRPSSSKDEKPPTASILGDTAGLKKRTTWELLKNSFQQRNQSKTKSHGTKVGPATSPLGSIGDVDRDHELEPQEFVRMSKKRKSKLINSLRNKPIENPYKKAKDLWARICPPHRNHLERVDLEQPFKKEIMDRVWKLFEPNGGDIVTRTMFKKAIVDMVNLRKSFTSTHKTFENAMAKLDMLFNIVVLLFVVVAFLIAYNVGVQQYAVSVSSLVVGCAFVTGTSAKNAFESMIFIFVMRCKSSKQFLTQTMKTINDVVKLTYFYSRHDSAFDVGDKIEIDGKYFTIMTIHILTTEMKRGDGLRVLSPNYLLAQKHIHNLSRANDHIDNIWMDIPLFSSGRTIQKLKQKIQVFCEGEALTDYLKIDVILHATNNHTKDGTSKACLQILFRVFYRCRWVDSTYAPRKLRAILFLRAALNELEQEDLNDLIAIRRAIGYGNHGVTGGAQGAAAATTAVTGLHGQHPLPTIQQQQQPSYAQEQAPVLNEAGEPVGFVGTSGNVYDAPVVPGGIEAGNTAMKRNLQHPTEMDESIYVATELMGAAPPRCSTTIHARGPATGDTAGYDADEMQRIYEHDQGPQPNTMDHLDARHVLVPETIQLSTNAANFQPYPNGFQFQR
ncbi:hypothetical protein EDD11_001325 [Mortierella claussenii]|nr:hypothetical protein EDD11_001325 [Mortierella claussenii]